MIKAGDNVKVRLLSTKTDRDTRMSRGLNADEWIGIAAHDLQVDDNFVVHFDNGEFFRTSTVQRVAEGIFHTLNSSYSIEKVNGTSETNT